MFPYTPPGFLREYSSEGTPVVLVGDILGGYASWRAHAERLLERRPRGRNWRVIAVSPLVVGYAAQGEPAPEPWSMGSEADALAAALDNIGVRSAHVGGWSLGGAVAIAFAMTYPERTRSLTLVEPQVRWVLRALGREGEADADAEEMRTYAAGPGVDEATLVHFLHKVGAVAEGEDPRESRAWRLAWTHRLAIHYAHRIVEHHDGVERLARLTMPALIVRGADTDATDRAMSDALAELLSDAERLVLPGGHTSHMRAMDPFLDALTCLVERAEPRPS
jgi:pimeloyl-ACP methyl ester carboxylesterase